MRNLLNRFMDWLCDRAGLCLRFDGDLMAPSGDEEWWQDNETYVTPLYVLKVLDPACGTGAFVSNPPFGVVADGNRP